MNQQLNLPAGFRFHPTDEELVVDYLCRKCTGRQIDVPVIAEIDLYKFDPWTLPGKALYGEKEWYFFSPRDRKYPNGSRPNRAAGTGYWKATGADKPVGKPKTLAIKKALVFYAGKAPSGVKTNWIMHEYRLANVDRSASKKTNLRLDDWVLCRIYNKKGTIEKYLDVDEKEVQLSDIKEEKPIVDAFLYGGSGTSAVSSPLEEKPKVDAFLYRGTAIPSPLVPVGRNNHLHFDVSDSMTKLQTDSSSSDHIVSSDFLCDKEVQSEHKLATNFESFLGFQLDSMDGFLGEPFGSQLLYDDQVFLYQDMYV